MDKGVQIETREGVHYLSGTLDEFADLTTLTATADPIRLDLSGIGRINSLGVRNILIFLNKVGNRPLEYRACPVAFIDQLNMIPALGGPNVTVVDFDVPYECPQCDEQREVRMTTEHCLKLADPTRTSDNCPKCQNVPMEVASDSYFVFLSA